MLIKALETASQEGLPLKDAEQKTLGYDHAQIGMALAQDWQFPQELVCGIRYHHDPMAAPNGNADAAHVLHVANYCCQKNNIGYCDAPLQDESIFHQSCQELKIEPHALELILGEVQQIIGRMEEEGLV